jgi:hypothetical protein
MPQVVGFKCFLCEREQWGNSSAPDYRVIRENQVRNLQYRLEELEDGRLTVERLCQGIRQMCGMCQMLMIGISGAADRVELRERITIEVQALIRELGIREKRARKRAA